MAPPFQLNFLLAFSLVTLTLLSPSYITAIKGTSATSSSFLSLSSTSAPPLVQTALGGIQGKSCLLANEVAEFLGIPFALSPVGMLRFAPPLAYNITYPEAGLDATSNPPACGTYAGEIGGADDQSVAASEDCLYLNMWVPISALTSGTGSQLPVRFWIHGGKDLEASASDPYLNGCLFAKKTNTIDVNVQFRKSTFGFLAHPETLKAYNTTGNWAIMDQQLALRWVVNNIGSFGGDPTKIMINGNSAGGQYVDLHMVAPASNGLFSSAISQSPPCVRLLTVDQAYEVTHQLMANVGCPDGDPASELACLRSLSWSLLYNVTADISAAMGVEGAKCESLNWTPFFQPVQDGNIFPYHVVEALYKGAFSKVPYMVSFAALEGTHFVDNATVTNTTFSEFLADVYPRANVQFAYSLFPLSNYQDKSMEPEKARLADFWTKLFFTCPIYERLMARTWGLKKNGLTAPAPYVFVWTVTPTCPTTTMYLGATHGSEILYTFGITDQIYPPSGTCDFGTNEVAVSDSTLDAWKAMMETGVPTWSNGTAWASWTSNDSLATILAVDGPRTKSLDLASLCSGFAAAENMAKALM
eukprot:TRINITY_DN2726_c0_g1_i1.p1 TRINITY_DN2726_c0_g1~~TRINITY_DN2726_c0_g1_i1.p1  ORF type:complete len:586 (-),score=59.57 TRINITY_DN2726_c0_g1_i1:425-2182(-)